MYWQRITKELVVSTGKGKKLLVPRAQLVDLDSLEKLRQVATRVVPRHRYSILRQSDTSWAGAKRYSVKVLLNGTLRKAGIADVIRQVVGEHIESRYYRDSIVEDHWQDSDAHVIFVFVYLTLEDERTANILCRSLWLSPRLAKENAPTALEGESTGDNIITEWSSRYEEMADLWGELRLKKEDYVRVISSVLDELKPAMTRLILLFEQEDALGTADTSGRLRKLLIDTAPRIDELYQSTGRMGVAPIECADVDIKLGGIMALAHNLVLPFVLDGADGSRNVFQERMAIEDYKKDLPELEYELRKIR